MSVLTTVESRPDQAWKLPSSIGGDTGTREVGSPKRWRWPFPVALLSWVLYSAAAVWMTETLHLQIGDSVARMNDARAMLFSRDPHLAAIGLYWMPLPTVGQLPFMLILSPLHHAELAGPLACAFCGALTVLVMAWIAWSLELSKATAIALTLVYAVSPIVVYTNGNGMSEAWSLLGLAITMLGFLRWSKRHRAIDLALMAGGLAVLALVRYETFVLAPILGVIAALNDGQGPPALSSLRDFLRDSRRRARRWGTTAAIVVVPTYFVYAMWMLMNLVIARNALNFYNLQKATGHTTKGAYSNLPPHNVASILGYCLTMMAAILPAMLILTPFLVLKRRYNEVLTGLGILVGGLIWPLIVAAGLWVNESAGAPRYFEPAVVCVTVCAMWLASGLRITKSTARAAASMALAIVVGAGAIIGTVNLENPVRTTIEREDAFFGHIAGSHPPPIPDISLSRAPIWKELAADLDKSLSPGTKVLADVSQTDFAAFLYTRYPDRYIINSDRDYLQVLANPAGRFEYLIVASPNLAFGTSVPTEYSTFHSILADSTTGHWVKWKTYFVATVYHFVANARGPGA